MDIKIEIPFGLNLDVIDTDEHVPAMQLRIVINVKQFRHALIYESALWFEYSAWDKFLLGLRGLEGGAELVDMGEHFSLKIVKKAETKNEISWVMKESDLAGNVVCAETRWLLDEDALAHIKNQFLDFDTWW